MQTPSSTNNRSGLILICTIFILYCITIVLSQSCPTASSNTQPIIKFQYSRYFTGQEAIYAQFEITSPTANSAIYSKTHECYDDYQKWFRTPVNISLHFNSPTKDLTLNSYYSGFIAESKRYNSLFNDTTTIDDEPTIRDIFYNNTLIDSYGIKSLPKTVLTIKNYVDENLDKNNYIIQSQKPKTLQSPTEHHILPLYIDDEESKTMRTHNINFQYGIDAINWYNEQKYINKYIDKPKDFITFLDKNNIIVDPITYPYNFTYATKRYIHIAIPITMFNIPIHDNIIDNLFFNLDIRFNFQNPNPNNNTNIIPINIKHMLNIKNPDEFNPKYFSSNYNHNDFRSIIQSGDFVPTSTTSSISRLDSNFPSSKYYSFTFMDVGLYDMRTAISPQSIPSCTLTHSKRICRREPCDWRYDSTCPDIGYRTVCSTSQVIDDDATLNTINCTQNNCTASISRYMYSSSYRINPKLQCSGFGLYNIYVSDITQLQHIYNDITYDYTLLHPGIPQTDSDNTKQQHNKILRNVLYNTKFEMIYNLVDAKILALGKKDINTGIKTYHSFTEFGTTFDDNTITNLSWIAIFFIIILCIIFFTCFGCCAIICGHRRGYGPATRLHGLFATAICFAMCFEWFRPRKQYDPLIDDTTTTTTTTHHHHHHHHHHVPPQPHHYAPQHPPHHHVPPQPHHYAPTVAPGHQSPPVGYAPPTQPTAPRVQ